MQFQDNFDTIDQNEMDASSLQGSEGGEAREAGCLQRERQSCGRGLLCLGTGDLPRRRTDPPESRLHIQHTHLPLCRERYAALPVLTVSVVLWVVLWEATCKCFGVASNGITRGKGMAMLYLRDACSSSLNIMLADSWTSRSSQQMATGK